MSKIDNPETLSLLAVILFLFLAFILGILLTFFVAAALELRRISEKLKKVSK